MGHLRGHIERRETALAALDREMREELGIEVLEATPTGTLSGAGNPDAAPFVMMVFVISSWSARPRLSNREHDAIRWFHPDELDALVGIIDERLPKFVQTALSSCTPPANAAWKHAQIR